MAAEFQALASGQKILGDVEHVVIVVVGQVDFQHAETEVDRLVEPELADQQVDQPDAADGRGLRAVGDLVMGIDDRHNRPVASAVVILVQAAGDLPLASIDLPS